MVQVLNSLNPLWTAAYVDPDVASYGETPSAREFEIRRAATPAGSGTLVQRRTDVSQIASSFRTGELLDALSTATVSSSDANAAAAVYSATHPTGYGGNHLEVQATGGSSSTRGVRRALAAGAKDLSVYAGGHRFRVQRRVTSVTNLTRWSIRFEFATSTDWAEYALAVATDAINTWTEISVAKDNPTATAGTVDWSLWSGTVRIIVIASGAYTGNLELADLRLGLTLSGKTVPDGDLAAETSYDARVRYRDNATAKLASTTAAAVSIAATNVKMTSVAGIVIGDWLTLATTGSVESRKVVAVGTAGAGGTGVDVDEGFTYAHGSGDVAAVYYWGAWTAWLTAKASLPPVVVATTPADGATVVNPRQAFAHTYSSPAGKAQASRTIRWYLRTGTDDALVYSVTTADAGLSDTAPPLLLVPGQTYAWEVDATDTDGLTTTSARLGFTTSFATQAPPTALVSSVDTDASAIALQWALAAGADHYRVYWVAADGTWVRIDGGPAELGDGLPALGPGITYYGGRHGINEFWVTAHNGAASGGESTAVYIAVSLDPIVGGTEGQSSVVVDGEPGFTFPVRVTGPARTRRTGIETLTPPGRGTPVHLNWRIGGKQISLSIRYRPALDGDIVSLLDQLADDATPFWFKPAAGYLWDPLRAVIVGLQDTAEDYGFSTMRVDLDESEDRPG